MYAELAAANGYFGSRTSLTDQRPDNFQPPLRGLPILIRNLLDIDLRRNRFAGR
jgi:hypothetical protein